MTVCDVVLKFQSTYVCTSEHDAYGTWSDPCLEGIFPPDSASLPVGDPVDEFLDDWICDFTFIDGPFVSVTYAYYKTDFECVQGDPRPDTPPCDPPPQCSGGDCSEEGCED